ncbi:MAG: phage major capsid protein, partial [Bacteroidota bacterium]
DYMGDFVVDPDARLAMRDLIPGGTTNKDAKTYRRVTTRAGNAAPTASGTALPESNIVIERVTDAVRAIGHYIVIDEDDIADVEGLRSLIDAEMTYGLRKIEDQQILTGDGTGQNLNGLIPNATAYSAALETALGISNLTIIDELQVSLTQLLNADYAGTGFVLHPQDWGKIQTRKTTDGAYIFVNPVNSTTPRLWGLPVVATTQMAVGAHLTGDFTAAAQLFDRLRPVLMLGYINDQFIKNEMAVKVRERLVLCVKRTGALVHKPEV